MIRALLWKHGQHLYGIVSRLDWSDAFDIVIVATLIYIALVWFRRTATRLVMAGITMLAGVYVLAKYFGLFLTTAIFQAFIAIFLIALVIIFQEEVRQFFERVAVLGLERRTLRRVDDPEAPVNVLVRSVADFARQRIGALIVLRGRDPLARHLEGGTELHGKPSLALFESLFDPHSPGHDGAVVMDGARVEGFAYRLPVSKDVQQTAETGLRHAAALGLAERTDACCIVVSEERGDVAVALDGRLQHGLSLEQLTQTLRRFYADRFPRLQARRVPRWIREHTREKLVAFALACGLWAAFAHQTETVRRDFTVPIEFRNLSPSLVIDEPRPKALVVTVAGEERAFQLFDPSSLHLSLNLSSAQAGRQVVSVTPRALRVPNEFTIVRIEPSEVVLRILPERSRGGSGR